MSGPIYGNGKRDEAEEAVVKAFRAGGASVKPISAKDFPDLVVGYLNVTHLVEVKTNKAKLREGQATFAKTWLGSPVVVARTPAQARKWLAVWRERSQGSPLDAPLVSWEAEEAADRERLEGLREPKRGSDGGQPA